MTTPPPYIYNTHTTQKNSGLMAQYIRYVADRLLVALG